jgi:hypothetical protein
MSRAVRAELVKLTTTWVWWGLLLIALGLVLLNVGLLARWDRSSRPVPRRSPSRSSRRSRASSRWSGPGTSPGT